MRGGWCLRTPASPCGLSVLSFPGLRAPACLPAGKTAERCAMGQRPKAPFPVAGPPARRARSQNLPQGRQLFVHPCRIVDSFLPGRAACGLAQRSGALSFGATAPKESACRLAQGIEPPAARVCLVKALALNDSDCVGESSTGTPCRVLSKAWLRRVRRSVPSRAFGISEKMRCLLRRSDGGLTSACYKPNEPAAAISENCAWLCGCKTFRNRNRGRFIVVEQWDLSRIGNDLRTSHVMRPPRRKPCRRAVAKGSPGFARTEASATEPQAHGF